MKLTSTDVCNDPRWPALRRAVYTRYGEKCMKTGKSPMRDGVVLNIDHIKPVSKHPKLAFKLSNLQILTEDENKKKSNTDFTDYRPIKWRIYYFMIRLANRVFYLSALVLLFLYHEEVHGFYQVVVDHPVYHSLTETLSQLYERLDSELTQRL